MPINKKSSRKLDTNLFKNLPVSTGGSFASPKMLPLETVKEDMRDESKYQIKLDNIDKLRTVTSLDFNNNFNI